MKLSQFRFDFPLNLIAQTPTKRREDARLMVVHKDTGVIENRMFKDVQEYFEEKDVFVVNNTKVFPARMYGRKEKTGAKIEVFLLRELNKQNRLWDVIVDPARKIRVGNKLYFGDAEELVAEVIDNTTSRGRTIRFLFEGSDDEFKEILNTLGETPLPKYIKRKPDETDKERYQTKAKSEGHRICSVGTTTMRALESTFTADKLLKPSEGWTNIFIHPPHEFSICDSLITNFHLPKTSLLIMACAFAGYDLTMEAYKKAIKDKYRFFSYGDAMLIL
ncbi:MAG: tRNA preQ1(34) S-adenosylmethionine ribosyltransferase-isomerase QueA [Chitinophagia bacterium]|nr:tRNA preQ1(34) S-adenosylmethionine ribosyltransferase-isomerase QueA [Chitinophagia bacterium]